MLPTSLFIITGSSKGIGNALVLKLLEDNRNQIIGISRTQTSITNPRYRHIVCDLGNYNALLQGLDTFFPEGLYKRTVLINNAGWIGQIAHQGNLDNRNIQKLFEVNTIAPAILMNAFVERYASQKNSIRIVINISSGASKKAIDGWSGYSASKAALNMLTETAQTEANLDGTGIRFFAVAPGVVDTDMQHEIRSASRADFSSLSKFKNLKNDKALSKPNDTADKIIYLIDTADEFSGVYQDVREF